MTSFAECGLAVGHATDAEGATGCTVIRGDRGPFRCGVAIVGRATGTRELALLEPSQLVDRVDAILLAGGSAYGLDAAAGVMRWMEERGRGFPVGAGVVPIVPAAEGGVAANPAQVEALAVRALEQAIECAVRARAPGEVSRA